MKIYQRKSTVVVTAINAINSSTITAIANVVLHVGFFLPFIGPTSMIQMKIKVTEAITTETKNKLSLNS
jgi:hypothetical protein